MPPLSSSSSSPCAACKLLRRKCTTGCVFAPYFPPDQPSRFACVHRVFGASNVAKLLNEISPSQREDAVNSLTYEAEARLHDPVYGCVGYIWLLQHKLNQLQHDLYIARRELSAYGLIASHQGLPSPWAAASTPPPHHQQQILMRELQQQTAAVQQIAAAAYGDGQDALRIGYEQDPEQRIDGFSTAVFLDSGVGGIGGQQLGFNQQIRGATGGSAAAPASGLTLLASRPGMEGLLAVQKQQIWRTGGHNDREKK